MTEKLHCGTKQSSTEDYVSRRLEKQSKYPYPLDRMIDTQVHGEED